MSNSHDTEWKNGMGRGWSKRQRVGISTAYEEFGGMAVKEETRVYGACTHCSIFKPTDLQRCFRCFPAGHNLPI